MKKDKLILCWFLVNALFTACVPELKLVSSVVLKSVSDTIKTKNGTLQLIAEILPTDATNKKIIWSVNNVEGYASINPATGLLTAFGDGTVTVRASATDGSNVKANKNIEITHQNYITERDPLLWPFASNSIWNMPIDSFATYTPANLEMPTSGMLTLDEDYIVQTPDEPNMNVYWSSVRWGTGDRCTPDAQMQLQGSVPVPQTWVVSPSSWDGTKPNAGVAVLLKDKRSIWQSQPFAHCTAGGNATTGYVYADNQDLYGLGYYGSHGGSHLSVLGGSLRNHELTPTSGAIHHVLKMNLCGTKNLYYDAVNKGYRWPALAADAAAPTSYGSKRTTPPVPDCRMGALMAIPPTVKISEMGLETDPGRILATCLQDYGGYVVDDTGWDVFAIETEWGPTVRFKDTFKKNWGYDFTVTMDQSTTTKWGRDIVRIYKALNIVTSNKSAETTGGGSGHPRQPLAPPLKTL